MDDLEFRRAIYADPQSDDPKLREAAAKDPSRQQFCKEMKQLDERLKQATKVAVPDGLAERILLRQSMQHYRQQRKRRFQWAMAASVVLCLGLAFNLWQNRDIDMSAHALAHIYHDEDALSADEHVTLAQVNAKLASFGGNFSDEIGKISYANFCFMDGVKSLHMVLETEQGKVTVFILPNKNSASDHPYFADDKYQGHVAEFSQASMIVVGEKDSSLATLEAKLKEKLRFSA
ncbi:DUF3379 family protein [Aliiglaciecola sp. CAU 1673]|uniref:DUF3379 family protein n=1 Tax=Aliiglaciecola sp. CAU 1673 TaxID=3032595 RepID=UPI0023D979E3|nr:DUF3379 family protein [Aliiglaciecola sp. CAU 1673]MDF2177100.1 DUF3379 family protein [Aliiglaciecola sp. CAU 1673]